MNVAGFLPGGGSGIVNSQQTGSMEGRVICLYQVSRPTRRVRYPCAGPEQELGARSRRHLTGWGARTSVRAFVNVRGFQSPRLFFVAGFPPRRETGGEGKKQNQVSSSRTKKTTTAATPTIAVCSHRAIESHRVTTATVEEHVCGVAIFEGAETRGSGEHPCPS